MINRLLLVCLLILSHSAYAQPLYEKHKGLSSYAIIQGTWQDRQALGSALEMEGLPAPGNFSFMIGAGMLYQLKSGTSFALEGSWSSSTSRETTSVVTLLPSQYQLMVRQLFLKHQPVRPLLGLGIGGLIQQLRVTRPSATQADFSTQIQQPGTSILYQEQPYAQVSTGINFAGSPGKTTEFVEIEGGLRWPLGSSVWHTDFVNDITIPGERFRQWFISAKAGITFRAQKRPRMNPTAVFIEPKKPQNN
jgi:hypothetical protein